MKSKDLKTIVDCRETGEAVIEGLRSFQNAKAVLQDFAGKISDAKSAVESIRDEMQEKYDNLSEKAQQGEKGEQLYGEKDILEEAASNLEDAETALQEDGLIELTAEELGEKVTGIIDSLEAACEKFSEL